MIKYRPRPFRAFASNKYFENRDEYDRCGQQQPHTFEEYVRDNLSLLKELYRKKEVDSNRD